MNILPLVVRRWCHSHPVAVGRANSTLQIVGWVALASAFFLWLFGDFLGWSAWEKRAEPFSIIAAGLVSLSSRLAQAFSRVKPLERIHTSKILRVGYPEYPPFLCAPTHKDTTPTGPFAAVTAKVARDHGWSIAWTPLTFDEAVPAVQSRRVDCVACLFKTPARDEVCDFAALLVDVLVIGLKRKHDTRIQELPDLQKEGIRVLVCQGEIGHEEAVHTLAIPASRLMVHRGSLSSFGSLLKDQQVDVILMDAISCGLIQQGYPDQFEVAFPEGLARAHTGFMVESGQPEFRDFLDQEIRKAYFSMTRSETPESALPLPGFTRRLI